MVITTPEFHQLTRIIAASTALTTGQAEAVAAYALAEGHDPADVIRACQMATTLNPARPLDLAYAYLRHRPTPYRLEPPGFYLLRSIRRAVGALLGRAPIKQGS